MGSKNRQIGIIGAEQCVGVSNAVFEQLGIDVVRSEPAYVPRCVEVDEVASPVDWDGKRTGASERIQWRAACHPVPQPLVPTAVQVPCCEIGYWAAAHASGATLWSLPHLVDGRCFRRGEARRVSWGARTLRYVRVVGGAKLASARTGKHAVPHTVQAC